MRSLKELFIAEVVQTKVTAAPAGSRVRVLDVGCGTASYVPGLLEQFPTVEYVGIEPITASFAAAERNTDSLDRATVQFGLAYDALTDYQDESFDVVFSLSVLEHVKQLSPFLEFCARYLAPGGLMVHRYDLGHALYPHNFKAWLHVQLGNRMPWMLPETQFVRYVPQAEVEATYAAAGVPVTRVTYHQMPNAKLLEKTVRNTDTTAIDDLFAWEQAHQETFAALPTPERERLFPAVAVWGTKS